LVQICLKRRKFAVLTYSAADKMNLTLLDETMWFPPLEHALPDGLLAVGGDLSRERLLLAYHSGIFPWFSDDEPPLWWSPDPRFVLFPEELKVSKSMKKVLTSGQFEFRTNTAFDQVIQNCMTVDRPGQDGTWITNDIVAAYTDLHQIGFAHSAEAWQDDQLVGGLYGIRMGNVFFGESMFSRASNASKFAFINWVQLLQAQGVRLIDCQVHTEHLESLGARMISRQEFTGLLGLLLDK
jgi:leucyl/phenylalanyl-tRNA--protein transferase